VPHARKTGQCQEQYPELRRQMTKGIPTDAVNIGELILNEGYHGAIFFPSNVAEYCIESERF
jgi:hypothetical protein